MSKISVKIISWIYPCLHFVFLSSKPNFDETVTEIMMMMMMMDDDDDDNGAQQSIESKGLKTDI